MHPSECNLFYVFIHIDWPENLIVESVNNNLFNHKILKFKQKLA